MARRGAAALAGGPNVWEVIETLEDTGLAGEEAVAATAEWGVLTHAQVHTAVRYYADSATRWTRTSLTTIRRPTASSRLAPA